MGAIEKTVRNFRRFSVNPRRISSAGRLLPTNGILADVRSGLGYD
jgi:hypothetical protein